ncbi:ABC transporter permease [Pusillimonas sp. CC-YST705]|uniref:ABC transporter permease n=1 Tax=Mesopusillimonas faecipullorum TaxID=2755040 RepID=A0ABS8C984_9BURK|nr:ABC transporter permease [Mesopusillimonas faecipullorum]MCB5362591.1 ABC transporter permease [Mesopusillimonas faecipullorum]
MSPSSRVLPAQVARPGLRSRRLMHSLPAWAGGLLLAAAMATPGFFSVPNLVALAGTLSLIGCVAVGMTFITMSGNVMSFALGATCAATSMITAHYSALGMGAALSAGLSFAVLYSALQGWLIGVFRANSLIVSIAALTLLGGVAQYLSQGQSLYAAGDTLVFFRQRVGGVPVSLFVLLLVAACSHWALRRTRFGHQVVLIGSNADAAAVAGLPVVRCLAASYGVAGLCAGVAGVLVAARFGSGTMEYGIGLDYSAISAVLVGGTAIGGGSGSVLRTLIGGLVIAVLQSLLLLHGLDTQYQYLLIGIIVLLAIVIQYKGAK